MPKHSGGDGPHYNSKEELQARIDEYFASCRAQGEAGIDGSENKAAAGGSCREKPCTLAGLAAFLGFPSRQALAACEAEAELGDILQGARLRIETDIEERLLAGKSSAAAIFWLKNHADYRDRAEVAHGGSIGLTVQIIDRYEVDK